MKIIRKADMVLRLALLVLLATVVTARVGYCEVQGHTDPAAQTLGDQPHGEGKDILCGHYTATLAGFLAEELTSATAGVANETDVIHCFLDIEVDPVAETISGTNLMTVVSCVDGLATFIVDLRSNMVVDDVNVNGGGGAYSRNGHTVEITLDQPYDVNESFEVAVSYHGSPADLGFSSFQWGTHDANKIFATLSEPWYAHTWWPCKDSLGDKFTIDIWVTVPDWMVVASNGLLEGTDAIAGNKSRFRWHESYPIITYLVSLAGTNYTQWTEYYNHAGGSMPIMFYAFPENLSVMQSGVADVVAQIETFSQAGVYGEYPFIDEKYGIATFQWGGGIEHQTITSQGVFNWWLNAHELAHQWWGDMITCGTWHDIWLNEGFATFSEALYLEKKPGGTHADYLNRMNQRKPSDYSGSVYVYDANSQSALFSGNNVYKKGAWVVHMLRHVVGDADFFDILTAYRNAYEGSSAVTDDLRSVAESVYGSELGWFFDEWVYGTGAPYYRYGWQYELAGSEHKVKLHIEQYQTAYNNFKMPIDITITTTAGSENHVVWNREDIEWYTLTAAAEVNNVEFDRDKWILCDTPQSVAYQPSPADFDDDGDVDFEDFAILAAAWFSAPADPEWNVLCDISNPPDLFIDERDLDVFVKYWLAGHTENQ